jgi:cell division protein FtsA
MGSRQPRAIAQQVLTDVLQPRAEEIIHFVRNEIRNAGYERQAGAGVILTGGGAMLKGFDELAESILDLPVRVGNPVGFSEDQLARMPELGKPEFATVSGLVLYGDRRRKLHDFHENSNVGFRKLFSKVRALI